MEERAQHERTEEMRDETTPARCRGFSLGAEREQGSRSGRCNYVVAERGGRYEAFIPPRPVPSIVVAAMPIVVVPVVSVPAVLVPAVLVPAAMPAPITSPVVDRTLHDDGRGCIALDHYRAGRGDNDRRRRHVDRDTARADEAADYAADKSAECGVAGIVAVGEGSQGECREGQRYA
jgi:hypothetical protein